MNSITRNSGHQMAHGIHYIILASLIVALGLSPLARGDTHHVAEDAYIDLGNPAENNGNVPAFEVSNIPTKKTSDTLGFVSYELMPLPLGARLEHAYLRLFVSKVHTAGTIDVYMVTENWNEEDITGLNDPAIEAIPSTDFALSESDEGHFVIVDVTPEVQMWLDGSADNFGFALVGNPAFDVKVSFDTKENPQTSHQSELELIVADISAATECGSGDFFDGDGQCIASADIGTDTNAETNCADGEYLNGDGSCVASADIGTNTNSESICADGEYLNGDGSCVASADIGTDTNAETNCADGEYLNGDGSCVASADIGTDTNAETICAADEYLNGDGSCVASADIGTDTNAETICAADEYLNGDGSCVASADIGTDTNAETICAADEYLNGDGSCVASEDIGTDTHAGTICAGGEYLNGDGACYPVPIDTDTDTNTHAGTICATGEYLDGDGACYPVPVDTDTNTHAGTICAAGEYLNGDGVCYPVPGDTDTNTNAETICDEGFFLDGNGSCRSGMSDWVIIYAEETLPGGQGHGLAAECPDGYVVLGGGYVIPVSGTGTDPRSSDVEVLGAFPDSNGIGPDGPVGWQYRIWYTNHGEYEARVRVRATCAKSDW